MIKTNIYTTMANKLYQVNLTDEDFSRLKNLPKP